MGELAAAVEGGTVREAAERLAQTASDGNIDVRIYHRAEVKDKIIKRVVRVMKERAVDCVVNRPRNVLASDVD